MATTVRKQRALKYLGRDFAALKRDFIENLRIYFPDEINDFNESSAAMLLLELVSYMGDNLSFYIDRKFQESFVETAREAKNLFKHAKQLGFKTFGKSPSTGQIDAYIKVPSTTSGGEVIPNLSYAGTIKKGASLKSKSGLVFETVDDIDFGTVDIKDPRYIQVGDLDTVTQVPTTYILKKTDIDVIAGETKTAAIVVTGYTAFKKVTLADEDVIEVISVKDNEGNTWYEVDYLAQDTIFEANTNTGEDSTDVPYTLNIKATPYRFVTEYDVVTNKTSLIFGTGDAQNFDGDLIPDLGDLSLPLFGKDAFSGFSLDPQNFLKTRTLGLAPTDVTLTIKYRVGGGLATNIGSLELDTVVNSTFDVGDSTLAQVTVSDVANSFEVLNPRPIQGGRNQLTNDEMRQLIAANFAAQNRMVVASDFVVRALSLPSKFGSVFRASASPSQLNKNAVELYVLSRDSNGNAAVAPGDLKTNLKRYLGQYRMVTDAIEILDGDIINISVDFSILSKPGANKNEVLVNCLEALKDFFNIESWQINKPINKTDIITLLAEITDVLSVIDLNFENRVGTVAGRAYSSTPYNIKENTKNGIIYSRENAIFEVKFPNKDITGFVK